MKVWIYGWIKQFQSERASRDLKDYLTQFSYFIHKEKEACRRKWPSQGVSSLSSTQVSCPSTLPIAWYSFLMNEFMNRQIGKPNVAKVLPRDSTVNGHTCSTFKGFRCTQEEQKIPEVRGSRDSSHRTGDTEGHQHKLRPVDAEKQYCESGFGRYNGAAQAQEASICLRKDRAGSWADYLAIVQAAQCHMWSSPRCYALGDRQKDGTGLCPYKQVPSVMLALLLLSPVFQSHMCIKSSVYAVWYAN